MTNNLPAICYSNLPTTGDIIIIKNGIKGYFPQQSLTLEQEPTHNKATVARLNDELGVTPKQALAMELGSMFGWDSPAVTNA